MSENLPQHVKPKPGKNVESKKIDIEIKKSNKTVRRLNEGHEIVTATKPFEYYMTTDTRNEAVKICRDLLDEKLVVEAKILPSLTTPCSTVKNTNEKWARKVLTIFTVEKDK